MTNQMKNLIFILISLLTTPLLAQFTVQPNATLFIGSATNLAIGSGVNNEGSFQNLGSVTFSGDWNNTNIYNDGGTGQLETNGDGSQAISNSDQSVGNLIINSGTEVTILGNTFEVLNELVLTNGIIRLGDGTSLVINENAIITGGSENSFVEGTLVQKGGGFKRYPLGVESEYLPLTLTDIANNGTGLEMSVGIGLFSDAGIVPTPASGVVGVSDFHYWELNVLNGTFSGSIAEGTFANADLVNFDIKNDFNLQSSTPALVQAPTLDSEFTRVRGELTSPTIDPSENLDFDPATAGTYLSSDTVNQGFVAIGLIALSPPEGILYVPTAFSPNASNPEDRRSHI